MSWYQLLDQWWLAPAIGAGVCTVAYAAGRRFLSGARVELAPADGTAPAVDPFISPPPRERRLAARRAGNAIEIQLVDPEGKAPAIGGWVVNRSLGGLCLAVESAVPEGTVMKVKVRNTADRLEGLMIAVKRSCAVDGVWQLNCQFVTSPNFNMLLMFG